MMKKGHKNTPPNSSYDDAKLVQKLAEKVWRRRKARSSTLGVWFGLGMMGLIGWSIAVPTILGAVLGLWLDQHYPSHYTWALALIIAGLTIGCLNAWHWIALENQSMHDDQKEEEEKEKDNDSTQ
ncbi:AtpZ/AtpI family protein [Vibrio fluvialis]|nr:MULTISPECIES: AtpZ/AtpI family protein [Vibrio]ELC0660992.1 AtpZ/AtpI family protein [Vibrio fluvialis]ELU8402430.1 AtpZ/AtpI family protein [Vibrio fluvialis]KJR29744.1 ATP synthase [Vibrio sp. S234-5]MBE3657215.1 F0F1 ATP synthase subunit [Vibrio navarrensis]MBE4604727.1 F0F1 ATP synthase subunit [Vibrio navarrensis]